MRPEHDGELSFVATAVAFERNDDLESEYLVLAERPDGGGHSFEVQLGLAEDEQDVRLGLTGYCLVRDGGPTHYGGVESWAVVGQAPEVRLTPEAAAVLGASSLRITLVPTGADGATAAAVGYLVDGAPRTEDFTLIATAE